MIIRSSGDRARILPSWARDTFLTDDPFVSQFAQFSVPEGTTFQCMGMLGNDWAYVSAEVSAKNTFTDGGAIVWGFVPLRDLTLMEAEDGGVYSGASSES